MSKQKSKEWGGVYLSRHAHERRGIRAKRPLHRPVFGVYRPIAEAPAHAIRTNLLMLQTEKQLPEGLRIRPKFSIPLFPIRELGKQMSQGIITEFSPEDLLRQMRRQTSKTSGKPVEADLKSVTMQNKHLCMKLGSTIIHNEQYRVANVLERKKGKSFHRFVDERGVQVILGDFDEGMLPADRIEAADIVKAVVQEVIHDQPDMDYMHDNPIAVDAWDPHLVKSTELI
jgi:hypothetical protein